MAGKTVSSDEDEIKVKEEETEEPVGEAVDSEDLDDEDDEDQEDEGEDEYDNDGFIVDDVDEDEQEDAEEEEDERRKKKKRKKRESKKKYLLDEDDYELLQDNNITGLGFLHPKVEGNKKFKRLKKARADADQGQSGFSYRSGKGGESAEEKLKHSLFGDDDDEGPPIKDNIAQVEEDVDFADEEEDEMADFIIDEEEEVDEHGEPTRRRRKVNKKKSRQAPGVSSAAIQEARDIFGDVDELLRQRKLVLERISKHDDDYHCGEAGKKRRLEDEIHQFGQIKLIERNRHHQVSLTCSESGLRIEKDKAIKEKALAKKHFKSRMIVHPRFRNVTADEPIQMLWDMEAGESIVRPSSRGHSYLTLTLKVYDGVYAHKHIIEGGKEKKDISSMLRLGKTLKIGDDVFEDLDEVMDRYVDPLVSHLKRMLSYRKFKDGGKTQVDELLRKEKIENPSRIAYAFGISHQHPGTLILTYIRSSNLHHEYVGLYPKGFKFRNKMFDKIDRLVAYFQSHITDNLHDERSKDSGSFPKVSVKGTSKSQ